MRKIWQCLKILLQRRDAFACAQLRTYIWGMLANRTAYKAAVARQEAVYELGDLLISGSGEYVVIDGFKFVPLDSRKDRYMFVLEYYEIIPDDLYYPEYNAHAKKSRGFFSVNGDSPLQWSDGGAYEIENVVVAPGDIVLDVGANMGIFSLLAARKGGTVYAFEPSEKSFVMLEKNIALNDFEEKIFPYQLGVSDRDGSARLYDMPENHLGASIAIHRSDKYNAIECVSLDSWASRHLPRVDFIKADIEGAERLLLDGACTILRQHKPKLALCTYHLPDDPAVMAEKILAANPEYTIVQGKTKLYAW